AFLSARRRPFRRWILGACTPLPRLSIRGESAMPSPARPCLMVFASMALAAAARAGSTIDAMQYLPLGAFNAWELVGRDAWAGDHAMKLDPHVCRVVKAVVADGIVRYTVTAKQPGSLEGLRLLLGVQDGVLYLLGLGITDPGADLSFGSVSLS